MADLPQFFQGLFTTEVFLNTELDGDALEDEVLTDTKNANGNEEGEASQSSGDAHNELVDALDALAVSVTSLTEPEGLIGPAISLSEVKQEPYSLPSVLEWTICDMNSDDMCSKVCKFLEKQDPDTGDKFKVIYSEEFLRWELCPPGYDQKWNIGVCVKTSKALAGFISGVPSRFKVRGEVIEIPTINLCRVHKKYKSTVIAATMKNEVKRRIQLQNAWQEVYSSVDQLRRTPVTTCQHWFRMLNPKKLIDLEFSSLGEKMTMSMAVKLYKLPDAPITPGFGEMVISDVYSVTRLLKNYLKQFGVVTDSDMNDVEHWLLPRKDIVYSYLVRSPETHDVTDFCSFYSIPYTIAGNSKYTTVECAHSFHNVATRTPLPQLMNDALIVAKKNGFDVFYPSDVMRNESFLKDLKFKERGCAQAHSSHR